MNAGNCTDTGSNTFECSCGIGYTDAICSEEIDECADAPCINGGVCTDEVGAFVCACTAEFTGSTCSTPIQNEVYEIAIPLSVLGNFLNSVGYIIQKKGHMQVLAQTVEGKPPPSYVKNKMWIIGFAVYTIGSLLHGSALGFGSQAVLTPMESITLVANTFLSPIFLGEKLRRRDLYAVLLIIIGCTLAVVFGPNTDSDYDSNQLIALYFQPAFMVMSGCILIIVIIDYVGVVKTKARCKERGVEQDGTMRPYGAFFLLCSYTIIAGVIGSYNVLLTKSFFEMFFTTVGGNSQLTSPWFYLITVFFLLANFSAEKWKQRALGVFGAMYVVPIYQVVVIVGGISVGAVYFKEFESLSTLNLFMFVLGVGITLAGVYVLAVAEGQKTRSWKSIVEKKVLPVIRASKAFSGGDEARYQFTLQQSLQGKTLEEITQLTDRKTSRKSLPPLPPNTPLGKVKKEQPATGPNEVEAFSSISGCGQLFWNYVKNSYIKISNKIKPLKFKLSRSNRSTNDNRSSLSVITIRNTESSSNQSVTRKLFSAHGAESGEEVAVVDVEALDMKQFESKRKKGPVQKKAFGKQTQKGQEALEDADLDLLESGRASGRRHVKFAAQVDTKIPSQPVTPEKVTEKTSAVEKVTSGGGEKRRSSVSVTTLLEAKKHTVENGNIVAAPVPSNKPTSVRSSVNKATTENTTTVLSNEALPPIQQKSKPKSKFSGMMLKGLRSGALEAAVATLPAEEASTTTTDITQSIDASETTNAATRLPPLVIKRGPVAPENTDD